MGKLFPLLNLAINVKAMPSSGNRINLVHAPFPMVIVDDYSNDDTVIDLTLNSLNESVFVHDGYLIS
jgi:hypothetical protein